MIQAGLANIILYENKNLSINYDTFTVVTGGETILLNTRPKLEIEPRAVNITYKIKAQLNDLIQFEVDKINNSIYGWIAVFQYLDGSDKIIERPFFKMVNAAIQTNTSHSREIELESWNRQGLIAFN